MTETPDDLEPGETRAGPLVKLLETVQGLLQDAPASAFRNGVTDDAGRDEGELRAGEVMLQMAEVLGKLRALPPRQIVDLFDADELAS